MNLRYTVRTTRKADTRNLSAYCIHPNILTKILLCSYQCARIPVSVRIDCTSHNRYVYGYQRPYATRNTHHDDGFVPSTRGSPPRNHDRFMKAPWEHNVVLLIVCTALWKQTRSTMKGRSYSHDTFSEFPSCCHDGARE